MIRDDYIVIFGATVFAFLFLCTVAFADHPKLPVGVNCELVRAKVAEHGKVYAYGWARLHGYSKAEINEARRCLR